MDWMTLKKQFSQRLGKYKYVLLILALGIFLMALPESDPAQPEAEQVALPAPSADLTQQLTEILSQIRGVGKVQVMLTESEGAQTHYQTDEDRTQSDGSTAFRVETVLISGDEGELGLIRSVTPPVWLGAIVVCQGGDDPAIKLAIVQAVSAVTGIGADRITVLKMK